MTGDRAPTSGPARSGLAPGHTDLRRGFGFFFLGLRFSRFGRCSLLAMAALLLSQPGPA